MRFTTLTVCSLTVLLAGGISAQASEIPVSQTATEPLPAQDDGTMPIVLEKRINTIAEPENSEINPLLQKPAIALQQKEQNPVQTVAEAKQATIAESLKQTEAAPFVANQAGAEALQPNQVIAQSSTNSNPQLPKHPVTDNLAAINSLKRLPLGAVPALKRYRP